MTPDELADELYDLSKDMKWTQKKVAELTGATPETVNRWFNRRTKISNPYYRVVLKIIQKYKNTH